APDKVWQAPREEGKAAFINLYCPPIEVGSNFEQEPICIAESRLQRSRILGPDVVRSSRHTAQEAAERISRIEAAEEDGEPYQLIWAKKRKPRKRDEEMARIHRGALDDTKTDKPLNEVPIRERFPTGREILSLLTKTLFCFAVLRSFGLYLEVSSATSTGISCGSSSLTIPLRW